MAGDADTARPRTGSDKWLDKKGKQENKESTKERKRTPFFLFLFFIYINSVLISGPNRRAMTSHCHRAYPPRTRHKGSVDMWAEYV